MRLLILILIVIIRLYPVYSQTTEQLVDICVDRLEDVTYLRDFRVDLKAAAPGQPEPVERFSMVLNKNTIYRLSICNSDTSGAGIIKVFDNRGLLASNYISESDTYYPFFDIKIQNTGIYHIFISFKDGSQGRAAGILSLVKKL